MLEHGINTVKDGTNFTAVTVTESSIPCFIGAWPCHTAKGFVGAPQIAHTYAEAIALGGYSDEWRGTDGSPKWSLCQAMYGYFKLASLSPAIFINVYDPSVHKSVVEPAEYEVKDHTFVLVDAIDDDGLSLSTSGDASQPLVKGTDYDTFYEDNNLVIELLEEGNAYTATKIKAGYNKADLTAVTAETISSAIELIEKCKNLLGIVPDLLCAPGWSQTPSVAALLAVKAASINGLFKGKAVVDLDSSSKGADTFDKVAKYKSENGYTDENQIVCWPLIKANGHIFDYSVLFAASIATVDYENGNCPFESPSNRLISISGACNADGKDVSLSVTEANIVSNAGVVTAINFNGGRTWGNYTACWPTEKDVAKHFICTSRVQDWICNNFVNSFWSYIDRPMTRILIDAIIDHFNLWLSGLKSEGKLYDGEIKYVADNNETKNLLGGHFRLDTRSASPTPTQRIDMHAEFSAEMLLTALNNIVA